MGETSLPTDTAKIVIHLFDPMGANHNTYSSYTNPTLDHVDLILGEVTGYKMKGTPEYEKAEVSTIKVIARFDSIGGQVDSNGIKSQAWKDKGNGWVSIYYEVPVKKKSYFRLRVTNNKVGSKEVDEEGNPRPDFAKEATSESTFADLWFYSNPIFVKSK